MADFQISLIGAGNVGSHLAQRFHALEIPIKQICSRTHTSALELAKLVDAEAVEKVEDLEVDVDLVILSVPDDQIEIISDKIKKSKTLVVHTSGSISREVLDIHENRGVFYPLQSFRKNKPIDWQDIPVCVDANSNEQLVFLEELGNKISEKVYRLKDRQRASLHVAAVFANNFSNHMLHLAERIAKREDVPFELLQPLIRETLNRVEGNLPSQMQTGPAKRGDKDVIQRHLDFLEPFADERRLYDLLSEHIQEIDGEANGNK